MPFFKISPPGSPRLGEEWPLFIVIVAILFLIVVAAFYVYTT
jgi:hypothetical protein